jgi:hypothetical protein
VAVIFDTNGNSNQPTPENQTKSKEGFIAKTKNTQSICDQEN